MPGRFVLSFLVTVSLFLEARDSGCPSLTVVTVRPRRVMRSPCMSCTVLNRKQCCVRYQRCCGNANPNLGSGAILKLRKDGLDKGGICPFETRPSASQCSARCLSDYDCPGSQKCCPPPLRCCLEVDQDEACPSAVSREDSCTPCDDGKCGFPDQCCPWPKSPGCCCSPCPGAVGPPIPPPRPGGPGTPSRPDSGTTVVQPAFPAPTDNSGDDGNDDGDDDGDLDGPDIVIQRPVPGVVVPTAGGEQTDVDPEFTDTSVEITVELPPDNEPLEEESNVDEAESLVKETEAAERVVRNIPSPNRFQNIAITSQPVLLKRDPNELSYQQRNIDSGTIVVTSSVTVKLKYQSNEKDLDILLPSFSSTAATPSILGSFHEASTASEETPPLTKLTVSKKTNSQLNELNKRLLKRKIF